MKRFFDTPKQVVFSDPDNAGKWQVGIAYQDEIICACCGGLFEIEEIDIIHAYADWVDIATEIVGGELPESFIDELNKADALLEEEDNLESETKNLS